MVIDFQILLLIVLVLGLLDLIYVHDDRYTVADQYVLAEVTQDRRTSRRRKMRTYLHWAALC